MKKLLLLLLMVVNYSIAANHTCGVGGTFTSLAQVNAHTFVAGDSLFFKRGETFAGTLTITGSGTIENPIYVGAYGTGAKPVITGFTRVTGWTDAGNGIWYKDIIQANELGIYYSYKTAIVTVDGINTPMGRFPNDSWLTYESTTYGENPTYTDNQLIGTPDWTGADLIVRNNRWSCDRDSIISHSTNTLTVRRASNWPGTNGFGYYFSNNIQTLDILGEWSYNNGRLYMYFGAVNPTTKTVKLTTQSNLVYFQNSDYVTYENLTLSGASVCGVYNRDSQGVVVKSCTIEFCGLAGIYVPSNSTGGEIIADSDTIRYCNNLGIEIRGANSYLWAKDNVIYDIGLYAGGFQINTFDNDGDGIACFHPNSLIEYNTITNVGHSGIRVSTSDNIIVRNNFIRNFGLTRYDAGGIYDWNGAYPDPPQTRLIKSNIIIGSKLTSDGIGGSTNLALWGIYLDQHSINTTVRDNTVSGCSTAGIVLYGATDIPVKHNVIYDNGYQLQVSNYYTGLLIRNCVIDSNQFISKTAEQITFLLETETNDNIQFGTANYNYYARPIDDNLTIRTDQPNTGVVNRTLSGWKTYSSLDANSNKSAQSVADTSEFTFLYNSTSIAKDYVLSGTMNDVAGVSYTGTITLQPFTSLVLMGSGEVAPALSRYLKHNGRYIKHNGKFLKL